MYIENGILYDDNGNVHNMHDYLSTKKYVPRVYDYTTQNASFINVHKMLKELKVENNNEHLQIFHPELIGVNPYDGNLSDDTKLLIIQECRMNLWYFLRELAKVPVGENMLNFEINLGSFSTTWLLTRRQNFFYEISRQIGKTYLLTTIMAWIILFGGRRMNLANIHHSKEPAIDNLNKVKSVMNTLPEWMQFHKKEYDKPDKKTGIMKIKNILAKSDNARTIECKPFKNMITTVIVGNSIDSANRAGRGATKHAYFIDEISHIKNNFLAMKALQPSVSTARKLQRKTGGLFGLWLLGTPGDLKTPHGRWMYNKIKNEYIPFDYKNVFLFDKTEDELNKWIDGISNTNYFHIRYDWDILGYDEEWFFEKNRADEVEAIRQETLLHWEESTSNSPFSRTQLAILDQKSKTFNPVRLQYDDFNEFVLYPREGERVDSLVNYLVFRKGSENGYVIGVDVANGTGNDSSAMCIVDAGTLDIVATYRNNIINTDDFSLLIVHILENVFQRHDIKCAIGIERNNSGTSVVAKLKKYPHILRYLIAYPVSDAKLKDLTKPSDFDYYYRDLHVRADIGLNVGDKIRRVFTDDLLFTLVSKHTDIYAIPDMVVELKGLIRIKRLSTTRIEHSPQTHDDLIFASFHAFYPIYYASNILKRNHNIDIDTNLWKMADGIETFEGNYSNKRIQTIYESGRDGLLVTKYYDIEGRRFVSMEEARMIIDSKPVSAIKVKEEKPVSGVIIEGIEFDLAREEAKRNDNMKASREKAVEELRQYEMEQEKNLQPVSFFDEKEAEQWYYRNNPLYQLYTEMDSENIRKW